MDSVLGGWIYRGFTLLTLAGFTGAVLAARRRFIGHPNAAGPRMSADAIIVLSATMLLVALQFIYYNIEFQQWQGRYLFPALIPVAFMLVYGIDRWARSPTFAMGAVALADAAGNDESGRAGYLSAVLGDRAGLVLPPLNLPQSIGGELYPDSLHYLLTRVT